MKLSGKGTAVGHNSGKQSTEGAILILLEESLRLMTEIEAVALSLFCYRRQNINKKAL